MAFYEFTEEENQIFTGLALRMNVAGVLLIVVGLALMVLGWVIYPPSLELVLLTASGLILFGMGFLTFRSAKRFVKIVETQGHDIMHLMEAMSDMRRLYTLVVGLVGVVVVFVVATYSLVN